MTDRAGGQRRTEEDGGVGNGYSRKLDRALSQAGIRLMPKVVVVHLGGILQKRGWTHIFSMAQKCFAVKQLNATLFCRETLKSGTFVATKWIPRCEPKKITCIAFRADSGFYAALIYTLSDFVH